MRIEVMHGVICAEQNFFFFFLFLACDLHQIRNSNFIERTRSLATQHTLCHLVKNVEAFSQRFRKECEILESVTTFLHTLLRLRTGNTSFLLLKMPNRVRFSFFQNYTHIVRAILIMWVNGLPKDGAENSRKATIPWRTHYNQDQKSRITKFQ